MSSTSGGVDAQTWLYPAPGSDVVPTGVTGRLGPVHRYDRMILQWYPDTIVDGIGIHCDSESGGTHAQAIVMYLTMANNNMKLRILMA